MQIKGRQHWLRCVGVWSTREPNLSMSSHQVAEDQDFLLQLDGLMALVLSVFMVFSRENPVDEPWETFSTYTDVKCIKLIDVL